MPGFDGTGPAGIGSRSGGGSGVCPPGAATTSGVPLRGIGRGGLPWGGGRGRLGGGGGTGLVGFCQGFFGSWSMTRKDEELVLANHASVLERELTAIRGRLATLKKDDRGKTQ